MTDPDTTLAPAGAAHRRAVVIGGGLAGMLAAAALRGVVDEVLVVESDELPDGPLPRKGLPQARHAHMFWSGGVHAAESLLPGVTDRWLAAGANRIPVPTGMVALSSQGWFRRWHDAPHPATHFVIGCSRDLLDSVVRDLVLTGGGVRVLAHTRVEGLTGSASRVTGVRVRRADGHEEALRADFVVDASGRGSRAPRHLAELGVRPAPERSLDLGLVYATRVFRAPEGADGSPVVSVQSDPRSGRPGQSASILPIEDGRWIVTETGTRAGEPTDRAEDFEEFARRLRHPVVGAIISRLEPLTDVAVSRSTRNTRRYYERVRDWPERFVVLGDALAAFNPLYGHGMSVAAQAAAVLRDQARAHGVDAPRLARRVQRALARPVGAAWDLAVGQDVFYPEVQGGSPSRRDRILAAYVDRLVRTSCGDLRMVKDLTDVTSLQAPLTALVRPRVLLGAVRGTRRPPLGGPPLTARERALVHHTDALT
ncbi:FAD-dependent monooxygenase [Streptomyces sp. NBC_00249]|uniref:FAD-dependent oxidoreductase n=1 Tax=Streptomyces sp. NBC_00249 TaxID=2975690 RepID=UPI00224F8141|nr:FAD-dependent monooxygenase [Streptomyces sp. NBC_00249]MCX5192447.1 FAD-dependent monooxygenase [Streptomyces sp. NBC_00249]